MATEYVPPSDKDTEDGDIFCTIIQANSKVTKIQSSECQLSDHDDGNAVYMNLTSFQTQTSSGEIFQLFYFIHL